MSQLPEVNFPSLYRHFIERSFRAVAGVGVTSAPDDQGDDSLVAQRCIEKGYKMFSDGHVKHLKFNRRAGTTGQCFVRRKVAALLKVSNFVG